MLKESRNKASILTIPIILLLGMIVFYHFGTSHLLYVIGIYLDLPNVIIHECGHGLIAITSGGSLTSIKINLNPAVVSSTQILGLAKTVTHSNISNISNTAFGYIFESLFFIFIIWLAKKKLSYLIIPAFTFIALLTYFLAQSTGFYQALVMIMVILSIIFISYKKPKIKGLSWIKYDGLTKLFILWYRLGLAHQIINVFFLVNTEWDATFLADISFIPTFIWKVFFLVIMLTAYFCEYWINLLEYNFKEFFSNLKSM